MHIHYQEKERLNSRVKDLIDMLLLIKFRQIDLSNFTFVIQKVFKTRKTHKLPQVLDPPPLEWISLYNALAAECDIKLTMMQAFVELNNFYKTIGP